MAMDSGGFTACVIVTSPLTKPEGTTTRRLYVMIETPGVSTRPTSPQARYASVAGISHLHGDDHWDGYGTFTYGAPGEHVVANVPVKSHPCP
jgi:hypothetical protein